MCCAAGPCPAFLLAAVLRAGKKQVMGKVQDACALLSSSDGDIQAAAQTNVVHRHLLKHQAFRCDWDGPPTTV